jgi:glutathione S-transferase
VGVEYEVVEVDYMANEHKGAEHLARNVCNRVLVWSLHCICI